MCQVIKSLVCGTTTARKLSIARPSGFAVTSDAAQPSANNMNDSSFSMSVVSCRCSVQSSMLTTSTCASGSERTIWRASFNPLIAA